MTPSKPRTDVPYRRPIDENKTLRARARHKLRVMKIQQAFGVLQERDAHDQLLPPPMKVSEILLNASYVGDPSGRGRPVRTHPNTPPLRDAFHQARHRRNKRARAARRLNR